jgi:hypothetical protein
MNPEFIRAEDINQRTLTQIFTQAFFKLRPVNEEFIFPDTILLIEVAPLKVLISLPENNKLIRFIAIINFRPNLTLAKKLRFVNKLNADVILARFFMLQDIDNKLVADYHISYHNGLNAYQIVNALRLFTKIVIDAIRKHDDGKITQ